MIRAVDEGMRILLEEALRSPAGEPLPRLVFGAPADTESPESTTVSLFLYDMKENTALREESRVVRRTADSGLAEVGRPPVHFDLHYAVSVCAGSPEAEHSLLGRVLETFLRARVLDLAMLLAEHPDRTSLLATLKNSQAFPLHVAQPSSQPDPVRFWQALGCRPRVGFTVVVTATVDPFLTTPTRVVRESIVSFPQDPVGLNPHRVMHRVVIAGTLLAPATRGSLEPGTHSPLAGGRVEIPGTTHATGTDQNGFFFFLNLARGHYTLRAWAPDYTSAEVHVEVDDSEEHRYSAVEIALERAVLCGQVLRAPGSRPVARAEVLVNERPVQADSSGYFAVTDLAPGVYQVHCSLPGYMAQTLEVTLPERPRESGTGNDASTSHPEPLPAVRADFLLQPVAVSGKVQDRLSHLPIAGARISLPGHGATLTDAFGRFSLPHLAPGRYWAGAVAEGYREAEQSFEVRLDKNGGFIGASLTFELEPTAETRLAASGARERKSSQDEKVAAGARTTDGSESGGRKRQ